MNSDEVPIIPQGLVKLPPGSERVTDADEEVFLLYTDLQGNAGSSSSSGDFRGLGYINSHQDTLSIQFELKTPALESSPVKRSRAAKKVKAPTGDKTIEVTLAQDKTALHSRKGDTGSVVWKASIDFAQMVLQQHHAASPSSFFDWSVLQSAHVVELGAGTGLLSVVLAPLVKHYTVTDIDALLPLIRKNLALNFPGWPPAASTASGANVSAAPLDWLTLHAAAPTLRARLAPPPADLLLVVDCIYHPALLPALVGTLDALTIPGRTAALVVVELRAEDVVREFLARWLALPGWEVWRVDSALFGRPYAAWLGWKTASQKQAM